MNIYEKLDEWLREKYDGFSTWIQFNAQKHQKDNTSIMSDDAVEVEKFIDGSKKLTVPFQVEMIKTYDLEPCSDTNMNNMKSAMEFIEWMQQQEYESNYPNLGDDIYVDELMVESDVPEMLVNETEYLAKYIIKCKIIYTKG